MYKQLFSTSPSMTIFKATLDQSILTPAHSMKA